MSDDSSAHHEPAWLARTRTSYDVDAAGYTERVHGLLDARPDLRVHLACSRSSCSAMGAGRSSTWAAARDTSPDDTTTQVVGEFFRVDTHRRRPGTVSDWLRDAGFRIEWESLLRPDDDVPGALVLARCGGVPV